ncbi:MAG: hypothetical protein OXG78_15375 [Chloroflexi bacterium]|nr:hypothetical protein [Chloroflexota bacterium]
MASELPSTANGMVSLNDDDNVEVTVALRDALDPRASSARMNLRRPLTSVGKPVRFCSQVPLFDDLIEIELQLGLGNGLNQDQFP